MNVCIARIDFMRIRENLLFCTKLLNKKELTVFAPENHEIWILRLKIHKKNVWLPWRPPTLKKVHSEPPQRPDYRVYLLKLNLFKI